MKIRFSLFLFYIVLCIGHACENSEDIRYPLVTDFNEWNIDDLFDKGEKCLLNGEWERADELFSDAIDLCSQRDKQEIRLCRGLIDRSIARASMGNKIKAILDLEILGNQIQYLKCTNTSNGSDQVYVARGEPILGEDHISVEDCIKRAENTINYIKDILSLAPVSAKWKATFIGTLYLLENRAIECCRTGGIWKACLQPLLEKWLELKDWEKECRRLGHWYLFD